MTCTLSFCIPPALICCTEGKSELVQALSLLQGRSSSQKRGAARGRAGIGRRSPFWGEGLAPCVTCPSRAGVWCSSISSRAPDTHDLWSVQIKRPRLDGGASIKRPVSGTEAP